MDAIRTRSQLSRRVRFHVCQALFDEAYSVAHGIAVYTLADPLDLRLSRYVGQTAAPRRRFFAAHQHCALWVPDERPWWVTEPKLRAVRSMYKYLDNSPSVPGEKDASKRVIVKCAPELGSRTVDHLK